MGSQAFEHFRHGFLGGNRGPREDPPTDLLLELEGEERAEAERLLIAALDRGDSMAVIGLGVMRSQAASEPLKRLFHRPFDPEQDYSDSRVEVALALWRIEEYSPAVDELCRVLQARPTSHEDEVFDGDARLENGSIISEFDRIDAVTALREVRTARAVNAVIEALDDPSSLVRSNAVTSLAIICGPYPLIEQHAAAMMSEDPARLERTKQAILSLIPANTPPPALPEGYSIGYAMPGIYDYIYYREAGKIFAFHVKHTAKGVVVHTGNYLSGMLGRPVEFLAGERERIVPRMRRFFEEQQMFAQCLPNRHPAEPKEWAQGEVEILLPNKVESMFELRLLMIPVLRMKTSRLPICGGLLAGAAGFVIGKFIHLLLDGPRWSVWLVSAGFGLAGAWVGQKYRKELDDQ